MPTYVYACKNCGHRFEQYQSFSEDSLVTCPECTQDALRKVFDSVGIVFKGPGFYSTDSSTSGKSTVGSSSESSSTDTSSATNSSSTSSDSSTSSSASSSSSSSQAAAS
ncbi:FmdB family zinc ribbon protein [Brachybacterium sp. J144]|uniref:FmdB family zinc ribbon protein n=1 Tax=Brachybacterium sp. J144 TaxID=3116487 RepID=UPI002E77D244|nr:FmdB family zinc ribbon protein [Brachybacterium sp. J144]MEE1649460.1 FmdB family zinc ribbon protein [Brachybacterium sp. J144]